MVDNKDREFTPGAVARLLDIDDSTVRRWCAKCIAGKESPIQDVRVSLTNRYYIPLDEVRRLRLRLSARFNSNPF